MTRTDILNMAAAIASMAAIVLTAWVVSRRAHRAPPRATWACVWCLRRYPTAQQLITHAERCPDAPRNRQ